VHATNPNSPHPLVVASNYSYREVVPLEVTIGNDGGESGDRGDSRDRGDRDIKRSMPHESRHRMHLFTELDPDDLRRSDIQKKISGWLGDSSGPRMLKHNWALAVDGLPILQPAPLIPKDVHLLGKGLDIATSTGGYGFVVSGRPIDTEECCILCDVQKKNHRVTLLFARNHENMVEVLARLPQIYYESGGSIIHAFYNRKKGVLYANDLIVFRGQHLNFLTAADRKAALRGPWGVDSLQNAQSAKQRLSRHMRNITVAKTAVAAVPVVAVVATAQQKLPAVAAAPPQKLPIVVRKTPFDDSDPIYQLILKEGAENLTSIMMISALDAARSPDPKRWDDEMSLTQQEIRIRCLPYSIFPTLPRQLQRYETMYFRGLQDYTVAQPQLYGGPSGAAIASAITSAIASHATSGAVATIAPTTATAVVTANPPLALPDTIYFSVPISSMDGKWLYTFKAKPSITEKQVCLYIDQDTTSTFSLAANPSINIFGHSHGESKVRGAPSIMPTVVCNWNAKKNTYTVSGKARDRCDSDTAWCIERRKVAQSCRLDMAYIQLV